MESQLKQAVEGALAVYMLSTRLLRMNLEGMKPLDSLERSVAGVLGYRRRLQRLLDMANAQNTVPDALLDVGILQALDRDRDAMLASLGKERIEELLLRQLDVAIEDWQDELRICLKDYEETARDEYRQFVEDEDLPYLQTLVARSSIADIVTELGERVPAEARARLADADALLRRYGKQIYGPLLDNGVVQRARSAALESPEHWWYYLDALVEPGA